MRRYGRVNWLVVCLVVGLAAVPVGAQDDGGTGNTTENINFTTNGILVNASGVVEAIGPQVSQARQLALRQAFAKAKESLPPDLVKPSPLRKLSLVRVEAACRAALEAGKPIPPELQVLAGIQRIDYISIDLEAQDLIIAGPANGFETPPQMGKKVVTWPRPPLQLDDLVVALRSIQQSGVVGCSIDPREQNLARMNQYLKGLGPAPSTDIAIKRNYEAAKILGTQDIRIFGVPADTHFAQVLLEADYRMKLISIGREVPPLAKFKSHLAMTGLGSNSSQRFWFVPFYEPFETNDDRTLIKFAGQRVQLVTQEEMVTAQGERLDVKTRISTTKFAQQFTDRYEDLAATTPVFAELQNVVDLSILAAWIRQEQAAERIGWKMSLFLDEKAFPVAKLNPPKTVETVGNHKLAASRVIGIFGGGIQVHPDQVLRARVPAARAAQEAGTASPARLAAQSWWSD